MNRVGMVLGQPQVPNLAQIPARLNDRLQHSSALHRCWRAQIKVFAQPVEDVSRAIQRPKPVIERPRTLKNCHVVLCNGELGASLAFDVCPDVACAAHAKNFWNGKIIGRGIAYFKHEGVW